MKKALLKDSFIQILKTRKRFISILLMAFLGVGFFAGIRSASPDMINTIDTHLDSHNVYDVQIVSTLGLTDDDVEAVKSLKSTESVDGTYSEDVFIKFDDIEMVVKVREIEENLNQITLLDGNFPQNADECVIEETMSTVKNVKIGDYIDIEEDDSKEKNIELEDNNEEDNSSYKNKHLKVVGIVSSPLYISRDRGTTTLGSGTISYYMYVNKKNINSDIYTELNIKVAGAEELKTFTKEYDKVIDDYKDEIESTIKQDRQNARYDELITEANSKLAEAEEKFNTEKKDAEEKIADAEKKILDGKKEIKNAEQKLVNSEKKLTDEKHTANTEISNVEKQIEDGNSQLNQAQLELDSKKAEYDNSTATANAGIAQIDAGIISVNTTLEELNKNKKTAEDILDAIQSIDNLMPELQLQFDSLKTKLDSLDQLSEEYALVFENYQKVETQISNMKNKREDLVASGITTEKLNQINEGILEAERKKSELIAQKDDITKKITEGKNALETAQNTINVKRTELESAKATLESKKAEASKKFADAEKKIADGKKDLAKAKVDVSKGEQELIDKKAEFDDKIADAEKNLIDAREKINDIENPKWYIFDRYDNNGFNSYSQDSDNIDRLSRVFPILFFLIAVLISLTTMTRMVEEERVQIGTLKALGYNNFHIISKYIMYSLLASILGGTIGTLFGGKFFPYIIIFMYNMMYNLTDIIIPYNFLNSVLGIVIMSLCMCCATIYTARKELKSTAAELMRPKAPKAGKRVLLERIPFIWKHLNFTQKVTIRNMFRYKKKFFMTVIGIAGCTALILTGFGIKDSIQRIMTYQYVDIYNYDLMIGIKDTVNNEEKDKLKQSILDKEEISECIEVYMTSYTIKHDSNKVSSSIVAPESSEEFEKVVNLKDIKNGLKIDLTDDMVIVTDKLAQLLSVKVGDKIIIEDSDKNEFEVTVGNICEHYISHNIYMTKKCYNNIFGTEESSNIMYAKYSRDLTDEEETSLNKELLSNSKVSSITLTSYLKTLMNDVLVNLNIVVYVLIISAALLAFIVLYNLSTINISERVRELATIKVLGFYDKEVYQYVTREIILLTIIGIIAGLLLGIVLDSFILQTVEVDILRFKRVITPFSYIISGLLTCGFTYIVNVLTYFSLKKINMIESLKSVE